MLTNPTWWSFHNVWVYQIVTVYILNLHIFLLNFLFTLEYSLLAMLW